MNWEILLAFILGTYIGASLTYKCERGANPVPFTSVGAVVRRFNPFGKRPKDEHDEDDPARRYKA